LEKNLVQHKADERIMRYKLEVYQKKIPNFVYASGSPTNTEASNKDKEVEARLGEIVQEEEVQIKEP
jgi:hypothetical protein